MTRRSPLFSLLAAPFLLATCLAHAGEGDFDPSFGADGNGRVNIPFDTGAAEDFAYANDVVTYADGSMVLVGGVNTLVGAGLGLVHLTANGAPHPSWQKVVLDLGQNFQLYPKAAALQDDGSIVVVGSYVFNPEGKQRWIACRVGADGTATQTFGNGNLNTFCDANFTGFQDLIGEINDVVIQSSGRIVVAGYVIDGNVKRAAVSSLTPDGFPDFDFADDGVGLDNLAMPYPGITTGTTFTSLALGQASSFSAVGTFASAPNDSDMLVTLYDATGTLAPTFGNGGRVLHGINLGPAASRNDIADAVAFSGNRLLVAGLAQLGPSNARGVVMALQMNGATDDAFGTSALAFVDTPESNTIKDIAVRPGGAIVASGSRLGADGEEALVTQFLGNGQSDASFGVRVIDFNDAAPDAPPNVTSLDALALQGDRIVVAGSGLDASAADPRLTFSAARLGTFGIFSDGFESD